MATHYGMTCYDLIHSLCLTPSLYSPRILLFLKAFTIRALKDPFILLGTR
jgi:hypothetical protein